MLKKKNFHLDIQRNNVVLIISEVLFFTIENLKDKKQYIQVNSI